MSLEENKALVRNTLEEYWNRGNLAIIDENFASDYVAHTFTEVRGPEGVRQAVRMMLSAFHDYHLTIEDEIAEGDKVAFRWTAHGIHKGEFQGVPPTGKRVTITGTSIIRIANGKLAEGWGTVDMLGLMKQVGAVPAPGRAGG